MKMTDTIFRFSLTALPPFLSFVINFRHPTGRWPFRLPTTTLSFVNDAQSCHTCPLPSRPLLITLDGLPFSLSFLFLFFFFFLFPGRGFLCHGVVLRSFFIRSIYIP